MTINSINGANTQMGQMGVNQAADSYSRNIQLRQHQMEQRKEKQQAKGLFMDDMLGGTRNAGNTKAGSKGTGLSQATMTAMISADSSIKQAKVQSSVATNMEGRAGILKSEIKQDQARGSGTQKKEEELAQVEQKAQAATSSQLSILADASKTMEEAAKEDSREEKTDNKNAKTISVNGRSAFHGKDSEENNSTVAVETTTQQPTEYTPVDIRL